MTINYSKLPEHIRSGAQLYIERGILPETFLQAIIQNDLTESFALMPDKINMNDLFNIVNFFYNEAPFACWGSKERMKKWIKNRRTGRKTRTG